MKTIVILIDTLCRRYLPVYGNTEVVTPNINRFAQCSTILDQHWVGSSPCMPARRDLFTGRLNFLERNWGGLEPFDHTLIELLQDSGVYCHMVTDHSNYLHVGGEGYLNQFNSWECFRGQENDPVASNIKSPEIPSHLGNLFAQHLKNRSLIKEETDYPSAQTMKAAVQWLRQNQEEDNYLLWIESFDPHEPFDTPDEYIRQYDPDYTGDLFYWPEYKPSTYSPEAEAHIRNRYKAKITMLDRWLGEVADELDRQNAWDDTLIILTTDHGFMLGEHNYFCKNYMPAYNEVFHIPGMIHLPGQTESKRINSLTQNIDWMPTLMEYYGICSEAAKNSLHGHSLLPILHGEKAQVRKAAIYGNYGLSVNVTDGKYTYFRAAVNPNNMPLYLYAGIPSTIRQRYGIHTVQDVTKIQTGRYLKWTEFPVYRIPANQICLKGVYQTFDKRNPYNEEHLLFDLEQDYAQNNPLKDAELERYMCDLLSECMSGHESPTEQWERLGISRASI